MQNIYAHMKDVHKITLNEYEVRYMNENGGGEDPGLYVDGPAAYEAAAMDAPMVEEPVVINVNEVQTTTGHSDR